MFTFRYGLLWSLKRTKLLGIIRSNCCSVGGAIFGQFSLWEVYFTPCDTRCLHHLLPLLHFHTLEAPDINQALSVAHIWIHLIRTRAQMTFHTCQKKQTFQPANPGVNHTCQCECTFRNVYYFLIINHTFFKINIQSRLKFLKSFKEHFWK